ncbi:MAG: anthranilate phosphoribosyltransferase [Rickettsiales bacterium]|nr:anthranilate phosphoribosyltransferase [Rickettsiales bacterium]|tara:strand:- start:92 stop:1105 length:1014 start_codon:yes stop_codon:yes gene_type:complete
MEKLLKEVFTKLIKKENLTTTECKSLVKSIFEKEEINDIQLSSLLTLLNLKKESHIEILSFVNYLKKKAEIIKITGDLMDTCGTGGDNKNSFNFSTATSILLSSFGVKIAKHGNRSVTSKSGSFDVLESLGINTDMKNSEQIKFFKKHGICFLFAPKFHNSLKKVAKVRVSLPFKSIFNLLGPLLNPTKLKYQLLGVSNEHNLETHAKCLSQSNLKRAWVVYNKNGYDELTTTSENFVIEVKNKKISKRMILRPKDLGFKIRNENELKGGSPEENAFILKRVFEGETGAIRDNVIINTAAGLLVSEKIKNLKDGVKLVKEKIDSGMAYKKLISIIKN